MSKLRPEDLVVSPQSYGLFGEMERIGVVHKPTGTEVVYFNDYRMLSVRMRGYGTRAGREQKVLKKLERMVAEAPGSKETWEGDADE